MQLDLNMFGNRRHSQQHDQSSIRPSSQMTNRVFTQPNKVLMQINQYVHPCERLPHFIKQEDLADLAADY